MNRLSAEQANALLAPSRVPAGWTGTIRDLLKEESLSTGARLNAALILSKNNTRVLGLFIKWCGVRAQLMSFRATGVRRLAGMNALQRAGSAIDLHAALSSAEDYRVMASDCEESQSAAQYRVGTVKATRGMIAALDLILRST